MPLLWISLCFVTGLVAGSRLPIPGPVMLGLGGAVLAAWICLRLCSAPSSLSWAVQAHSRMGLPPVILLAALFFGLGWWQVAQPDLEHGHVAAYNHIGRACMEAVVAAPPEIEDETSRIKLRVERIASISPEGQIGEMLEAHGLALAVLRGRVRWEYGDRLLLTGLPATPPENEEFSYRDYLARQGIYTYLAYPGVELVEREAGNPLLAAIYRLRGRAYHLINHLFPAPEAPLLAGILIGIDTDLPEPLSRAFQDTGTAHIIAISGFNIAILSELIFRLFRRLFLRWWAALLAILTIAFYTLLVGAGAAVVRAAIMGSLSLIAGQIGRRSTAVNSLAFAAALMCLFNPHLPWDASFQLSFGATLGLALYADPLQNWLKTVFERQMPADLARRIAGPVGEYGLLTLAAQLTTLPFILLHFGRLSMSSLAANPLILPVQPLVMVLSGLAVLAGLVSDPLGHLLASLALPASTYTIRVVETLAGLPGGVLSFGEVDGGTFVLLSVAALSPALGVRWPGIHKTLLQPAWLLAGTAFLAMFCVRGYLTAPDGDLHLTVYQSGSNPAVLVRGPGGETLLIDGGASSKRLNEILGRALPPFSGQLDAVLLNDPSASSMSGLQGTLDRFPLQRIFWGCTPPEHGTARRIINAARNTDAKIYRLETGSGIAIGPEAKVHVLARSEEGSALLIEWGGFRALLPGGIPPNKLPSESAMWPTLMILDQRDMDAASAQEWQSLGPLVVFTVLVEPVEGAINWFNTSPDGWLAVHTDGQQMWLEQR